MPKGHVIALEITDAEEDSYFDELQALLDQTALGTLALVAQGGIIYVSKQVHQRDKSRSMKSTEVSPGMILGLPRPRPTVATEETNSPSELHSQEAQMEFPSPPTCTSP